MTSDKDDLKEFIKNCKERLQIILNRLQWTEDGVMKNFNTNSLASDRVKKSLKIVTSNVSTYPESLPHSNSVVLETHQLQDLLENTAKKTPANFDDYQRNFSREEKLKIYEHVIKNTRKLVTPSIVDKKNQHDLTFNEIVARKRKEKSKKRRHRISKPTYIEEVRALVDLQMQALEQYLGQEEKYSRTLEKYTRSSMDYDRSLKSAHSEETPLTPTQERSISNWKLYRRDELSENKDYKRTYKIIEHKLHHKRKETSPRRNRKQRSFQPESKSSPPEHHHRSKPKKQKLKKTRSRSRSSNADLCNEKRYKCNIDE